MSKQIKRNEIAEEGVLDNLLNPLKELLGTIDKADEKLKGFAESIKSSVKVADDAKGMRELEQATQSVNKAFSEKLEIDKQREKLTKDIERAEAKLVTMQSEEFKKLQELKKAQREQTQAVKDGTDAYKKLSREVRDLKNDSKTLGAELLALEKSGQKNTKAYAELAQTYEEVTKKAQQGDAELKKLDKTVGDNFRNVGNYEGALEELNKTVKAGGMGYRKLRQMIKQYQDIAVKAGRTSPVGKQAIEDASKLQDELDTLQAQTKALADDGANMKAALQLGEVVASSYQGVLAVQQMLGVESERILEVMAKIQAVQVVINNLNKIRNSLDKASILTIKAKNLALRAQNWLLTGQATATKVATVATNKLNIAMRAVPIMAVVAGLTALVGWLIKSKDKTDELTEATDELTEAEKRYNEARSQRLTTGREIDDLVRISSKLSQSQLKNLKSQIEQEIALSEVKEGDIKLSKERIETAKQSARQNQQRIDLINKELESETLLDNVKRQRLIFERDLLEGKITQDLEIIRLQEKGSKLTDDEIANIEKRKQQLALVTSLIKEETKAVKENNEEKQKGVEAEFEDEEIKDVGKALEERFKVQEEALHRQFLQRRKNNIETITDQEKFNQAELENQIKLIDDLIQLRKDYNEDTLELELQRAELLQQFDQEQIDNTKEIFDELKQFAFDYYDAVANRAMQAYKNQEQAAQQMYGALAQMASTGNITAKESLAEQVKAQEDAQKAQMKIEQQKQKMQLISQGLNTFGSFLDAGDNPQVALGKTGVSMASLIGLINSLPSFFVGTEDTGKNGRGVDGKGGFISILHPNERVMTAEQNALTSGLSNPMLAEVAYQYKTGQLVQRSQDGSFAVVSELVALRRAVEKQPKMITGLEETLTGMVKLVVSEKKGNHRNTNTYKS